MSYSTIYYMHDASVATDGVQSQAVCDATINTARSIARHDRCSVIVEDRGTEEYYRVTPAGHIWRLPKSWRDSKPSWEQDD